MSESRLHERYKTAEGSLALADGNMAKIVDISRGGVSVLFLDKSLSTIPQTLCLDLLSTEPTVKANQIPGELAWAQETSFSTVSESHYKKAGIQFGDLSPQQQAQLEVLISNYAAGGLPQAKHERC